MFTPSTRPRGDETLPSQLGRRDENVSLLSRRISDLKRPKVPTPLVGGVADQAEVWSVSGTVQMLAGDGNLDYSTVRYNIPYRIEDNAAPDWITTDVDSPWRLHLEPGWYDAVMFIRLEWLTLDGPPESFGPYMGGGDDAPHNDYSIYPRARLGSSVWGITQYVPFGHFYHHSGDDLHVEVRPIGPTATANSNAGQIGFTFTRLTGVSLSG